MKIIVVLCACVLAVYGAPTEEKRSLPAVEHTDERDELGQYTLRYVTAEGTIVVERGRLVDTADGKDKVLTYEGSFTFVGDDGKTYTTKYKSDVNGAYHAEGDHLPKSVEAEPVPEVSETPKEEVMQPSA
ncbi:unnamed protein product [Chilo suppressalis]|uniref:Uncharacterized protein n=1 Tax=Chilo suppressalis TaxID=168631 RepID=A0ABN8BCF7_CHISP|nr:hypothetical protein evm_002495 [Chilo suppressalis]CAH0407666.1 unnamed protein product [Chilo suppressalis]